MREFNSTCRSAVFLFFVFLQCSINNNDSTALMSVFQEYKTRIIVKQYFFSLRSVSKTNPRIGVLCYVITCGNMDRIVLCEKQQTVLSNKKQFHDQTNKKRTFLLHSILSVYYCLLNMFINLYTGPNINVLKFSIKRKKSRLLIN